MHNCDICKSKIVRHKPSLFCDLCDKVSHYKCNKLTKSDALYIIRTSHRWTCSQCNVSLFPQFKSSGSTLLMNSQSKVNGNHKKVIEKCGSCSKHLGPQRDTCTWCGLTCHQRCIKGQLGCTLCASEMFPGYNCSAQDLTGNLFKNVAMFNPYDDIILANENDNIEPEEAEYWQDASDCLLNCNYKQHKSISNSTDTDLKLFSLNIRSLNKHITQIRDDIDE